VNFILDADIRSYFDTVNQAWLIRFLKRRINDPRMIHLIQKWLRAGILEDGIGGDERRPRRGIIARYGFATGRNILCRSMLPRA